MKELAGRSERTLLGDIGGTNARFAVLSDGVVGSVERFDVARYAQFQDVVAAFLEAHSSRAEITGALLAVAGPVAGGRSVLTNISWTIDANELRQTFGLANVRVVNDFEAIALALPHLMAADLYLLGGGQAMAGAPMVVLGPGTGLGVACLVPHAPHPIAIASQGGHITLASTSARDHAVIEYLRRQFHHVSAERAISGPGLENLYQAIAALDGAQVSPRDAAGITKAALDGSCRTAHAALDMFCAFLGAFAGNAALMFGARGGVYVGGGIAPRILEFMVRSEFRNRFEGKGRYESYLRAIPSNVIVHPGAAFIGLQALAQQSAV
jgi:glucokinase